MWWQHGSMVSDSHFHLHKFSFQRGHQCAGALDKFLGPQYLTSSSISCRWMGAACNALAVCLWFLQLLMSDCDSPTVVLLWVMNTAIKCFNCRVIKCFNCRVLGTPTEDTWPGVSQLPEFKVLLRHFVKHVHGIVSDVTEFCRLLMTCCLLMTCRCMFLMVIKKRLKLSQAKCLHRFSVFWFLKLNSFCFSLLVSLPTGMPVLKLLRKRFWGSSPYSGDTLKRLSPCVGLGLNLGWASTTTNDS